MVVRRHEYAIYNTMESDGDEVCITDSLGRYFLIHTDDWSQFVQDIINYNPHITLYPVGTTFKEMEDDSFPELTREFNDLEDRGHR